MKKRSLYKRDDWQTQFEDWKSKKNVRETASANEIKREIEDIFTPAETPKEKTSNVFSNFELRKVKTAKILFLLIAALIILYVLVSNFFISHEFNYFYDIGGEIDSKTSYLSPSYRISENFSDGEVTARNLTSQLVYFNVPIANRAEKVDIEVVFKDNFPSSSNSSYKMIIGARNSAEWNYTWKEVYENDGSPSNKWISKKATFYIKDDKLTVRDGKLSVVFNNHHLNENINETNKNFIPVDKLNITVYKPGVFD